MSKFNKLPKAKRETNVGGGRGFGRDTSDQTELQREFISIIFNSMLKSGSYYESETKRVTKIREFVRKIKSEEFLLKALVYTRTVLNLRSVSHVIACAILDQIKGNQDTKIALSMVMIRPDDATEIVALWNNVDGRNIPNALRKAIKFNLETRWDAYQLKKYYGNGKVKVPDLIKLTHPKNKYRQETFKQALEDTLPNIVTAQTINAQGGENRSAIYEGQLLEGKLGVMAALKNITKIVTHENRNMTLPMLHEVLTNKERVRKSKVLPFRFAQAFTAVEESGLGFLGKQIQEILEAGFKASAVNMNLVNEGQTVAVLLDASGSMGRSDTSPFGIGRVMASAILSGLDNVTSVGVKWATQSKLLNINKTTPLAAAKDMYPDCGGGTNLGQAIDYLIENNYLADIVIILTDMQENNIGYAGWGNTRRDFESLRKQYTKLNPNVKFIFWNLEGYGGATPAVLNHNVLEVSGFSEKMLELIPLLLKDKNAILNDIMAL